MQNRILDDMWDILKWIRCVLATDSECDESSLEKNHTLAPKLVLSV
jgi:hypothetical protein